MTRYTEGSRTAEFLLSEAEHYRSRDEGHIAAGADETYSPGTVLGQVSASKAFMRVDPTANDGTETAVAVLFEGTKGPSKRTVVARSAQVFGPNLEFHEALNTAQKETALADLAKAGIVVRN